MKVTIDNIKMLREKTLAGYISCKEAIFNSNSMEEAEKFLIKKGLNVIDKSPIVESKNQHGIIKTYTHPGNKICSVVEVVCDTDFVAKTDEFQTFSKEVAMQIASMKPLYVSRQDVPFEVISQELSFRKKRLQREGFTNDDEEMETMLFAEMEQWFTEACLLEQAYIRNGKKSIKDLLAELISKTQENCKIKRFFRLEVGAEEEKEICEEQPMDTNPFTRMPFLKIIALMFVLMSLFFAC